MLVAFADLPNEEPDDQGTRRREIVPAVNNNT
jgi:hypothetical protein